MAQPGALTLGIIAGRLLDRRARLLERQGTIEILGQFANADRAHHGKIRIQFARHQRRDLVDRAGTDHRIDARVAAGIELGHRQIDHVPVGPNRLADSADARFTPGMNRPAG